MYLTIAKEIFIFFAVFLCKYLWEIKKSCNFVAE